MGADFHRGRSIPHPSSRNPNATRQGLRASSRSPSACNSIIASIRASCRLSLLLWPHQVTRLPSTGGETMADDVAARMASSSRAGSRIGSRRTGVQERSPRLGRYGCSPPGSGIAAGRRAVATRTVAISGVDCGDGILRSSICVESDERVYCLSKAEASRERRI